MVLRLFGSCCPETFYPRPDLTVNALPAELVTNPVNPSNGCLSRRGPLRVLIVEDSEGDSQLLVRLLQKAGYEITFNVVETESQMRTVLPQKAWDLVISDYSLPEFDGPSALRILQESGLDLPFIVVSGTMGEDAAVAMMKAGAHDYLIKGNLTRLVPAIERELNVAEARRERRKAVETLRQMESRLRQSEKMEAIGQLASGIAHDFNNVLGGIIGFTEMSLEGAEKDSDLERNLLQVLKASDRAKKLVSQIMTFSRQGNQQRSLISLGPIIEEALDLLKASVPSSVVITADLSADAKRILADSTNLHEVFINLATNAVHAMNRKGNLTFRLYSTCLDKPEVSFDGVIPTGRYTTVEIADTGCGMHPETLSKAFEPFFTTKAVGEGTGMGLSVVHGIVQSHHGAIKVESEVGKGTTFRLYFPVADEPVFHESIDDCKAIVSGNERILFVDDEPMMVNVAKFLLSGLGYKVTSTSNSLDALKYFSEKASEIDVLITDQTMPNMTGVELVEAVLKLRKDLPVIICTGYFNEMNAEKLAGMGNSKILMKPFGAREIGRAIREVLDKKA